MQFTSFTTGAAVLLALAQSVAAGTAHVYNNCGHDVYYASVASGAFPAMQKLPAGGFSQGYGGSGSGISIKLSPTANGAVTQFEFSMNGNKLSYDMSNIDGNPFALGGMSLVPSMAADSNYPTCIPVNCPAGEATCTAAYNHPDDVRTLVCSPAADLTLTLCSGGSVASSSRGNSTTKREAPADLPSRVHARHMPKLA